MAVLFNGKTLITPAVESAVDDSAMYPTANPAGNVLALIGESAGGTPKKALRIRSPLHARQVLRSGPLYEAVVRAFAPSAATGSPAVVLAVRVNPARQSTLPLLDAAGGACMALTSTDFGAHTAGMEVRLEAGSKGGYRVSVRQDGAIYSRDNVGAEVLTLQYTGPELTAQVACAAGQLTLEAPTGTVVRTYQLADWGSAASLAEAITGIGDWAVAVTRGQERFAPAHLDKIAATSALSPVELNGHAWAIWSYISSAQEILLDATLSADQVKAPAMIPWTPLSGGINGNVVAADWSDALDALHEVEANWLVPLTDNPTVWEMVAAHCTYLSGNKRERRAFVGAGTGVSYEQAQAHAIGINNDRVGYVWPAVYYQNQVTGKLELAPAYMAAVNLAAAFACLTPGETMSRKSIAVSGTELQLREPTDTDALLEYGVCALVQSNRGVFVSQAVSTWQSDARYDRREVSVGAAVDYVARSVRAAMEPLLGTRGDDNALLAARTRLTSVLSGLSASPPSGPGILVGDAANPPYRIISIDLAGDVLTVAFQCSPVIPINYVLIGISITPYSGTATA